MQQQQQCSTQVQEYFQNIKRKTFNPILKMSFISDLRCALTPHSNTIERLFLTNAIVIAIQWYLRAFKQLRSSAQELRLLSDMACGNFVIMAAIGDTETHTHIPTYARINFPAQKSNIPNNNKHNRSKTKTIIV